MVGSELYKVRGLLSCLVTVVRKERVKAKDTFCFQNIISSLYCRRCSVPEEQELTDEDLYLNKAKKQLSIPRVVFCVIQ